MRPIFIGASELARLHAITRHLVRLIQRTCFERSAGDHTRLVEMMGYPREQLALLSDRPTWNK
ncbi:MAG: hypothetical protein KGJ84_00205 [Elusimicrobia bacterium]|nr:hypothetical protein [Elusimicrobiota bacterium]